MRVLVIMGGGRVEKTKGRTAAEAQLHHFFHTWVPSRMCRGSLEQCSSEVPWSLLR